MRVARSAVLSTGPWNTAHFLLVVLAQVAAGDVGRDRQAAFQSLAILPRKFRSRVLGNPGQLNRHVRCVGAIEPAHEGGAPIDSMVRDNGTKGGRETGAGWHDQLAHAHSAHDLRPMQRARSAEGNQVELAVVVAAIDRHEPNGAGHVLDGHAR